MAKNFSPYHYERDLSQVNRFLKPIKEYASDGSDIHSHVRSKTRKAMNYHATDEDKERDQIKVTEYNNVKTLYGSEYELSVLNAQKQKAINASQEYLLDKDNIDKNNAFIDAQYELRQGRGQYIANHIRSDKHRVPFGFKFHSQKQDELDIGICHLVEFTCTENEHDAIPVPIMAKVDNTQYNIFKLTNNDDKVLQTKHIMEVIDASQERVLKQYGYNNSKQDVELLKRMIEAIKVDVDSADRQSIPRLEANAEHWDDTARHAYKMTNDKTFSILNPDSKELCNIIYRFGINIIIPTKIKVEHNVKTVHRFALDFSRILNPMHIDLIVKTGNKEFVWTIHEFEQGKHQIFHTGYTSADNRLFKMPNTIEEMTKIHEDEEYSHVFFNKASIESACMAKNDYDSLLNLHVNLSQSSLLNITGIRYKGEKDEKDTDTSYYTDVGYVYKYNHYTIIASGIKCNETIPKTRSDPSSEGEETYANFYTIIRWNNAPHSQNSTAVSDPHTIQITRVQNELAKMQEYIKGVDASIGALVAHRANPPEAALNKENFYIPAILGRKSTEKQRSSTDDIIGVFYLTQCTKENRDLISSTMTRLRIKLLIEHFGFTSGSTENNNKEIYKELERKLTNDHGCTQNDLLECKQVPTHFGMYLKKMHVNEADRIKISEAKKTGLDIWSNYWHEYFELRPELTKEWMEEDSREMKVLNAHMVDAAKRYAAHKKGYGNHDPHAHRNGQMTPDLRAGGQPAVARHDQSTQITDPSQHTQPDQIQRASHHNRWARIHPIGPSGYGYPAMIPEDFVRQYIPTHYRQVHHQNQGNVWYGQSQPHFQNYHQGQRLNKYSYPMHPHLRQHLHLYSVVDSPEFIPQSKLQAEIDTLKRTLNELTLKAAVP